MKGKSHELEAEAKLLKQEASGCTDKAEQAVIKSKLSAILEHLGELQAATADEDLVNKLLRATDLAEARRQLEDVAADAAALATACPSSRRWLSRASFARIVPTAVAARRRRRRPRSSNTTVAAATDAANVAATSAAIAATPSVKPRGGGFVVDLPYQMHH